MVLPFSSQTYILLGVNKEKIMATEQYMVYRHGRPAYMKRRTYSKFKRWVQYIALGGRWAA